MHLRGLAFGSILALAIFGQSPLASAEKVGVAAAVNPDAFSSLAGSPQSQLSIGKSIFYNERINTTGSGLAVRSRHVMEWIDVEPVWLLCPELADVFEGREAFQGLEALGEVIGVEEGFQVDP